MQTFFASCKGRWACLTAELGRLPHAGRALNNAAQGSATLSEKPYRPRQSIRNTIRLTRALVSLSVLAGLTGIAHAEQDFHDHGNSPLIQKVRQVTEQFRDFATAQTVYDGETPCVSGPNEGAMGVHIIKSSILLDGAVDVNEPEALIYEPMNGGHMRLVGVEYIVTAPEWAANHPDGSTPAVDGHLMNFVGAPNRYGLPEFYELHVWAWVNNPKGNFADWNTRVSCERQTATE